MVFTKKKNKIKMALFLFKVQRLEQKMGVRGENAGYERE